MSLQPSSATAEEDWYDYRVEWDDKMSSVKEMVANDMKINHYGPGSHEHNGYDNAWDDYCDLRSSPDYSGVRLIRINPDDGTETPWDS